MKTLGALALCRLLFSLPPGVYTFRLFFPPPLYVCGILGRSFPAPNIRFDLSLVLGGVSSVPFRVKYGQTLSGGNRRFAARIRFANPSHVFETAVGPTERNCDCGRYSHPPCGKRAVLNSLRLPRANHFTYRLNLRFVQH